MSIVAHLFVMPGLASDIHAFPFVDGRVEPGHDGKKRRKMSPDEETVWQLGRMADADKFADACVENRDTGPSTRSALQEIMVFLATELWDRSFSQTEIQIAFTMAIDTLPGYAAGEEQRSDRQ